MPDIDMDAILAQRAEATNSDDPTIATFVFARQEWVFPHPMFAADDWKDGLADVQKKGSKGEANDVDLARYYLGEEQYERFIEAGGNSGIVLFAVQDVMRQIQHEAQERPTRSSTFSARRQKR
ncbi:hypothetical protein [Pseudonocardia sp. WMMC193]|uniref:hypothetical protein n=1 Tax=Pseudonocardia sp. WMMC193 TaxID=2911965 RepID=UPI001F3A8E8F|nr:hypothetical protein [Pseudonocardia sp. WMMC193]MCF7550968.1 hypothetical protein [Pseudonocardia sp. WMMC193]